MFRPLIFYASTEVLIIPKIPCYCPFKILRIAKNKKIYNLKLLHGQKYAKNCVSEGLKLRT
jgi:hypothetical protein